MGEKTPDQEGPRSPRVDAMRASFQGFANHDAGHMSAVVRWLDTKLFHDGSVSASPESLPSNSQLEGTPENVPALPPTLKQDAECHGPGQLVLGVPPCGRCKHVMDVATTAAVQAPSFWFSEPPRTAYRHGGG